MSPLEERSYEGMMKEIKRRPTGGSSSVIFTLASWKSPNTRDPNAAGMFFNEFGDCRKDMIHAVIEGVCLHLKWQLSAMEKKVQTSDPVKFVGGGALAPLTCQILADVLDRRVETVDQPPKRRCGRCSHPHCHGHGQD